MLLNLAITFLIAISLALPAQAAELSYSDIERSKTLLRLMPLVSEFRYYDNNPPTVHFVILDETDSERAFGNRTLVLDKLKKDHTHIQQRPTQLSIETFETLKKMEIATSVVFIQTHLSDIQINQLIDWANEKQVLLFSPFKGDVERGIHAGLKIQQQTRLYLNITALQKSGIQMQADIYRISEIYGRMTK